jgi:hypothetical protein
MIYWPSFIISISCLPVTSFIKGSLTFKIISALSYTSWAVATNSAPAAAYSSSVKNAPNPAPFSITTFPPSATIFFTVSGIAATRLSPGIISLGIPNVNP